MGPTSPFREQRFMLTMYLVGFLAVFGVHLFSGLDTPGPIVFEDEMGYLLNARTLAEGGSDGRIGPMGFYNVGWSLLLTPIALIIKDPSTYYRIALTLVALLGALHVVPLTMIARRVLGMGTTLSFVSAVIVAMYPGRASMAGYVYSEPIFSLVFLCALLLMHRYLTQAHRSIAVFAGCAIGFLYAIHGRGLAVIVASFLFVGGLVIVDRRKYLVSSIFLVASVVVVYLIAEVFHRWLKENLYELGFDRFSRTWSIAQEADVQSLVSVAVGLMWYLAVSSLGLAILGVAFLLRRVFDSVREPTRTIEPVVAWYLLCLTVFAAMTLPGMAVPVKRSNMRLDYLIYGRHWDAVISVVLLAGIAALVAHGPTMVRARVVALAAFGVGVLGTLLKVVAPSAQLAGLPIAAISVGGIASWIDPNAQYIPVRTATLGAAIALVLVAAIIIAVGESRRWLLLGVFLVGFPAMVWRGEVTTMRHLDRPWQQMVSRYDEINSLGADWVQYDTHQLTLYGRNGYRYWVDQPRLTEFDSSEELPQAPVVISRSTWHDALDLGAIPYTKEPRLNETVWILPGPLQDEMIANGTLCAEPVEWLDDALAANC